MGFCDLPWIRLRLASLSGVLWLLGCAGVLWLLGCAGSGAHSARAPHDVSPAALYPLHEGSAWAYDVDAGEGQSVLATSRVLRIADGWVEVQSGQGVQRYQVVADGIRRAAADAYLLRAPIAVGSSWQAGPSTRATVKAVELRMKTPAGEFDGCVLVQERNGESGQEIETTYCPGVGPVRVESGMTVRGKGLKVVAVIRGVSLGGEE